MNIWTAILISAVAGSFFNMLIYRLNNGVSLFKPRHSICPSCRERLHWFELIPVFSYLRQRGVCNSCGVKIPRRYLYVELAFILTAVLLVAVNNYFVRDIPLGWLQLILSWFIWGIIFSDLEYQEVPYFFSGGFLWTLFLYRGFQWLVINIVIWLALFLLIKALEKFYYKKPAFGGADFLLLFGLALYYDLPGYVLLLFLAFFLGALISLTLLAFKRVNKNSVIPFAPFIMAAFILVEYGVRALAYRIFYA